MNKKIIYFLALFITNNLFATEWVFDVILNQKIIGEHRFNYENDKTTSQANFDFNYLFMNFKYLHKSIEIWDKNCLNSIISETNDDGKFYKVEGIKGKNNFSVTSNENTSKLPLCVMTFMYGNPKILDQSRLMNSQTGELLDVDIKFIKKDNYPVRGKNILANLWQIQTQNSETDLLIYLWYDEEMRWIGLKSDTPLGFMHYRLK